MALTEAAAKRLGRPFLGLELGGDFVLSDLGPFYALFILARDLCCTIASARPGTCASRVAYVVVPTDFAFKEHGKPGKEVGALFTVSLQNGQAGWRITGWAWSRP